MNLLSEILKSGPQLPSIVYEDNQGAIFMANNNALGPRTKHIDIRYRFISEETENKRLVVRYIRSENNPSDCASKNVKESLHIKHKETIYEGLLSASCKEDVDRYDQNAKCMTSESAMTEHVLGPNDCDLTTGTVTHKEETACGSRAREETQGDQPASKCWREVTRKRRDRDHRRK